MLAQLFEKSIILKYSAAHKGATAYLKTLYFPYTYTIIRASMWGSGFGFSVFQLRFPNWKLQLVWIEMLKGHASTRKLALHRTHHFLHTTTFKFLHDFLHLLMLLEQPVYFLYLRT